MSEQHDVFAPEPIKWGFATSPDADVWGKADDLAAAIAGAQDLAVSEGLDAAYICAGQYPQAAAFVDQVFEPGDCLERFEEAAADNGVYSGDSILWEPEKGWLEALEDLLETWAFTYLSPSTWTSTGKPVKITAITAKGATE